MTLMRSAGSSPAGSYDPFTPEVLADPAAAHRHLRERCPVHRFDGFGERGFYTVSRHADVDRLFRDVSLWSSEWGQCPGAALARREARVALDLLIDRLSGLRLTGQPERTDSFMMWGPKSLRVAWDVPVTGGHS